MSHNNPAQIDYYQQRNGRMRLADHKGRRKSYLRARSRYPLPVGPSKQYKANARRVKAPLTYLEMP